MKAESSGGRVKPGCFHDPLCNRSYDGEDDVAKAFKRRMQQVSQHQKQPKQRGLLSFK